MRVDIETLRDNTVPVGCVPIDRSEGPALGYLLPSAENENENTSTRRWIRDSGGEKEGRF